MRESNPTPLRLIQEMSHMILNTVSSTPKKGIKYLKNWKNRESLAIGYEIFKNLN
jgi:hypothetical protein